MSNGHKAQILTKGFVLAIYIHPLEHYQVSIHISKINHAIVASIREIKPRGVSYIVVHIVEKIGLPGSRED